MELYNSEKQLDEVKSEIRITKRFSPDNFTLNIEHLNTQIQSKESEIQMIQSQIQDIRTGVKNIEFDKNTRLEFQRLQEDVIKQRDKVLELKNNIDLLKKEIVDSEYFIEALNDKYRSLDNSIQTRDFLGGLPLEYCPECLNKLVTHSDESSCKLCKQTTDDKFGINQAKRMQLEIKFQIDESSKLLKIKKEVLTRKEIESSNENKKLSDLQIKVNNSIVDVRPFELERLDNLNFEKGLAEGEILQFRTMLEQAQIFEKLLEERVNLEAKIRKLGYAKVDK